MRYVHICKGKGMVRQIWMEYRKLWNKVSAVAVITMCVVAVIHIIIYLNLQWRTIESNGQLVEGLASYRALRDSSKELDGIMDGEYIKKLIASYEGSYEKKYLEEHKGFLSTGGMMKYMVPNYCINYAYYGPYMSNGNEKVGLDYDYLESEEKFYTAYKEAVKENLEEYCLYSDEQLSVLNEKADDIKTPFTTGYAQGLFNLRTWFMWDYSLVFFVLVFSLAVLFSNNYSGGITEFTLSAKNGRRMNMNARWIAGNLYIVSVYFIYLAVQIIVNGVIGTLDGWNISARMLWPDCLHNITLGEGLIIMFMGGLLGALVIGNIVIMFSIVLKNNKLTAVISVIAILLLGRIGDMPAIPWNIQYLLNPMYFDDDSLIQMYMFAGNVAVPYMIAVPVVALLYVAVIYIGVRIAHARYRLH